LDFVPLTGDASACRIEDFHRPGFSVVAADKCYLLPEAIDAAQQLAEVELKDPRSLPVWDGYQLGQNIVATNSLTEFSPAEYAAFRVGNPALFPDERIFKGRSVSSLGTTWTVLVGSASGKIYKIVLQRIAGDQASADQLFRRATEYFVAHLGKESTHSRSPERYIWDGENDNLIVERLDAKILGESMVTLYLTSLPGS
jgi:hypothetical protein